MNLNIKKKLKNNQSFANEGLYLQIFAYFVIYISLYINSLLADAEMSEDVAEDFIVGDVA